MLKVLIDTWWNVNHLTFSSQRFLIRVLIDTWWNVNEYTVFPVIVEGVCFNRYMVECE